MKRSLRQRQRGIRRPRSGFTIVELIVAVVVMAVGVLGLAATASTVMMMIGGGARQTLVANVAVARMERLRSATSCASIVADSAVTRGIKQNWTATPITRGVDVTLTVNYAVRNGRRSQVYRTVIPC